MLLSAWAATTPGPGGGSTTPLLAQAAAPDLSLMNCVLQDGRVPLEAQMGDKHARQAQVGAHSSRKVRKHLYCGEGGSQVEICRQTHRQDCHRKPRELGSSVQGGWVPRGWAENTRPICSSVRSVHGQGGQDSGVQEAVEGVVGGLQVKQHLAHLVVVQLVGRRHAAQGLQPGGREHSVGVGSEGGIPRATWKGQTLTTG